MSTPPRAPKGAAVFAGEDRRVPAGPLGSLRWLKSLLGRPLTLQRRAGKWQLVLADRRSPSADAPPALAELRSELRARLLAHSVDHATALMRHLVRVHDQLGRKGWPGVEAMSARVLGLAMAQAQMLISEEPSGGLSYLVDRLRVMHVAAQLREERQARTVTFSRSLVVTEATQEEFDEMERSWVGMMPAGLQPADEPADDVPK